MTDFSLSDKRFVILIPDLSSGGGERVTLEIANALVGEGASVKFLTSDNASIGQDARFEFEPIHWSNKFSVIKALAMEMTSRSQGTIFIAVLTGPILLANIVNRFYGAPLISMEHSDIENLYLERGGITKRVIRRILVTYLLRRSDRISVVSPYLRKRAILGLGCAPNSVRVVQNPVQCFLEKLPSDTNVINEATTLLTVYLIGRNSAEKRLLKAIELLSMSTLVGRVIVVSDINEIEKFAFESYQNCWPGGISLFSSYAQIQEFCVANSVLLNFCVEESYSLVIGEWLASSLKVVTVTSANLKSLWAKYRGCHFISTDPTLKEMNEALSRSMSDYEDERVSFVSQSINKTLLDFSELISDAS